MDVPGSSPFALDISHRVMYNSKDGYTMFPTSSIKVFPRHIAPSHSAYNVLCP